MHPRNSDLYSLSIQLLEVYLKQNWEQTFTQWRKNMFKKNLPLINLKLFLQSCQIGSIYFLYILCRYVHIGLELLKFQE